jgi:mono/diheme cytochrome c family protein
MAFGNTPSGNGFAASSTIVLTGVIAGLVLVVAYNQGAIRADGPTGAAVPAARSSDAADFDVQAMLNQYCVVCHNQQMRTANLGFDTLNAADPTAHPETWEKVINKLRTGTMPPAGMPRPDSASYLAAAEQLETQLDAAWRAKPNPGRISPIHRLNRTEYNNAVRDLLAVEMDVRPLLPGDETADGSFDNFAAELTISTAHMDRYMTVARQLTRQAVGLPPSAPEFVMFRVDEVYVQTDLVSEDMPLGSRGGMSTHHFFPADGDYEFRIKLSTNDYEYIKGMGWAQPIDLRVDGKLVQRWSVGGGATQYRPAAATYEGAGTHGYQGAPEWEIYMQGGTASGEGSADARLHVRTFVPGGPHTVAISFPAYQWELETLVPQPPMRIWGKTLKDDGQYMGYAAVNDFTIGGPYQIAGPPKDTPSRRAIFVCEPKGPQDEESCATRILSRMARRAYRRPVTDADVKVLMQFFAQGRQEGKSFDAGIQLALERMLVDPDFLLRTYRDPGARPTIGEADGGNRAAPGDPYPLSPLEVASRLSFFLWSSIPDDELLDLAEQGKLTDKAVLREQAKRMLADPRAAHALTLGWASQWLNLRVLEDKVADEDVYPTFDSNLTEALRVETEMFVASQIQEDLSILDLLRADYTYANERLARHYGIPNVYGSRFRRVQLPNLEERGGLLGMGALLALTSYPNRTSPVIRGKWLLDNILGAPVGAPPPGVQPSLESVDLPPNATIRDRLSAHRKNPVCATCHSRMDPLGFALEGFDAIGAARTKDEVGNPVDDLGSWPGGVEVDGFSGLRAMLLAKDRQFVTNVTEKLTGYGLGRMVEYYDKPTIRQIVKSAAADDYRWSSIIMGIVESPAFLMRAPADAVSH